MIKSPMYDWANDPNKYRVHGDIPADRCIHCGHRFVGWQKHPFCNICTIAHYDKAMIPEDIRSSINSRIRIPEDMTEAAFVIREKKREADRVYEELKNKEPVESNFKRAIDLE